MWKHCEGCGSSDSFVGVACSLQRPCVLRLRKGVKLVPRPEHVDGIEDVGKYTSSPKRRRIKHSKALRISAGNVARIII